MCRLYGQISVAPAGSLDFLADSRRSLLVQSDFRPANKQKDGWGVGFYRGKRAVVTKSPNPAFEEAARFRAVAGRARSRVVIGHLRAASNPRGLPAKAILGPANVQPFTDGKILFAHNGTLQIPDEVAAFLGPFRDRIQGNNDSEVFFWQFMKQYRLLGRIPEALEACVRETRLLWNLCRKRYPDKKAPHAGLNVVVSDGESLHALCLYPKTTNGAACLFDPDKPWGQMSVGRRGSRVVVASEDMDEGRWSRLRQGEIVSAAIRGDRIDLARRLVARGE